MARTRIKRVSQTTHRRVADVLAAGEEAGGVRAKRSIARRNVILAAALEEFSARGYEAARLDDVARRAGIAKGTIYLYFSDKEALFQELVRSSTPIAMYSNRNTRLAAPMRGRRQRRLFVVKSLECQGHRSSYHQ
jgi:AcrR family transcriptional regulator